MGRHPWTRGYLGGKVTTNVGTSEPLHIHLLCYLSVEVVTVGSGNQLRHVMDQSAQLDQ